MWPARVLLRRPCSLSFVVFLQQAATQLEEEADAVSFCNSSSSSSNSSCSSLLNSVLSLVHVSTTP